jgi:hypothetical protein
MLGTRPDIAFAVIRMSQFSVNPSEEHLNKAIYILRYLAGTRDLKLVYDGRKGTGLYSHTDSDWAENTSMIKDEDGNPYRRRSTTGHFFSLADAAITWTSHAQKTIAHSSTEAEYMALSSCARQAAWLQNFYGEIGFPIRHVPIWADNQRSIFIGSNPTTNAHSKHIDLKHHYVRQQMRNGKIELYFCATNENPADILTKALGRVKFQRFRPMLGLK